MLRWLAAGAFVLGACAPLTQPPNSSSPFGTTQPAASQSASPSPNPTAPPARAAALGALLARPVGTPFERASYHVAVIADDGRVVASVKAREPSPSDGFFLPKLSATTRGVYYLDGDTDLKLLRPDGTSATVRQLPGSRSARVVFAVSPDDEWIALSVISYGPPDPACQVSCGPSWTAKSYVERLTVAAERTDFAVALRDLGFAIAYPVGWRQGMVVLADGYAVIQNPGYVNPYAARDRYALVDPKTDRVAQRIGRERASAEDCAITGPLVPAGTACLASRSVRFWTWDGMFQTFVSDSAVLYDVNEYALPAALSPSGSAVAVALASGRIVLAPSPTRLPEDVVGSPIGWLDDTHLVFAAPAGTMKIFDKARGSVTSLALINEPVAPFGTFFAPLTTGLD